MKSNHMNHDSLYRPLLLAAGSGLLLAGVAVAAVWPAAFGIGIGLAATGIVLGALPWVPRRRVQAPVVVASLLEESARVLLVDFDLASSLTRILRLATERLDAQAGWTMLRYEDSEGGFLTEATFLRKGHVDFPIVAHPESNFCRSTIDTGKPQILSGELVGAQGTLVCLPIHVFVRQSSSGSESSCVGVLCLLFDARETITHDVEETLVELASLLGIAIAPRWHRRSIQKTLSRTLEMLVTMFEDRSEFTQGHSKRVSEVAVRLGRKLGLAGESLQDLQLGTLLHDIGKIAIPENILNKPGKLTSEEFEIVQQHAAIGYEMCRPVGLPDCVTKIVRNHHENLDGTGYPDGLSGPDLSLFLRIAAVADSFDAMCSCRAYREPMGLEKVIAEVTRHAGTQFDPVVVEKLRDLVAANELADLYGFVTEFSEEQVA